MRLESPLFPSLPPLMSSHMHMRKHLWEALTTGEGLVWSDRFTERAHQIVKRVNEQLKRMAPGLLKIQNTLNLTDIHALPKTNNPRGRGKRKKKSNKMKAKKAQQKKGSKLDSHVKKSRSSKLESPACRKSWTKQPMYRTNKGKKKCINHHRRRRRRKIRNRDPVIS